MEVLMMGFLFWGIGVIAMFVSRSESKLSKQTIMTVDWKGKLLTLVLVSILMIISIFPMGLSDAWNGKDGGSIHHAQYEFLAESILKGHVYVDYGDIDPTLLEMENPYDPQARAELGVNYYWDHAFYNGHYYIYFGVVPVFLLFLPYRMITGMPLETYHATQIFAAFIIIGMFMLFYDIARKFFSDLPWIVYLSLSTASCLMSLWYWIDAPALYCTAISAGVCMEVWSLFFFVKAVWGGKSRSISVILGMLGSLFGALSFGCRPTVALANLIAIPLFLEYIKGKKMNWVLLREVILFFLPYIVIGAMLMLYNYVRFENPFEFGQTWQLTAADQSNYGSIISNFSVIELVNGLVTNFISFKPLSESFPYIGHSSILFNFPICIFAYLCFTQGHVRKLMHEYKLGKLIGAMVLVTVIITEAQVLMSPILFERYRSDLYWLMGIICFMSFGLFLQGFSNDDVRRRWGSAISLCAIVTAYQSFLLWAVPWDANFTELNPEWLECFSKMFFLRF